MSRRALLSLVLAGCGASPRAARPVAAPRPAIDAVVVAPPPPARTLAPGDAELVVTLRHTGCFGRCPVYSIELYASGLVCWDGARCGTDEVEHRVPIADVQRVIDRFTAARFLDRDGDGALPGQRVNRGICHDGASAELTFTHDGRRATVIDDGCPLPEEVNALFALVADVTGDGSAGPDGLR